MLLPAGALSADPLELPIDALPFGLEVSLPCLDILVVMVGRRRGPGFFRWRVLLVAGPASARMFLQDIVEFAARPGTNSQNDSRSHRSK